jgi:hypothetical protein
MAEVNRSANERNGGAVNSEVLPPCLCDAQLLKLSCLSFRPRNDSDVDQAIRPVMKWLAQGIITRLFVDPPPAGSTTITLPVHAPFWDLRWASLPKSFGFGEGWVGQWDFL